MSFEVILEVKKAKKAKSLKIRLLFWTIFKSPFKLRHSFEILLNSSPQVVELSQFLIFPGR